MREDTRENLKERDVLEDSRHVWRDIIKLHLKRIRLEDVDLIYLG
jgi:hypothetical protein